MEQTNQTDFAASAAAIPEAAIEIPSLVKRNTLLLAAAQGFVGAGNQLVPTLGAIMVMQLLGSANLAGLATSILGLSRFLVAYPIGKLTDAFGRKMGMILGLVISLVGALALGLAMAWSSFALFVVGIVVFGLGIGAGQQLRLAAADMYPLSRRAEGLGIVLTGSIVGSFGGPVLVSAAQNLSPQLQIDAVALSWILVPIVIIPSIFVVFLVRPDPKDIAMNLERYYPGYVHPVSPSTSEGKVETGVGSFVRSYPALVALVSSFASQGNMAMIMAMTSLTLAHHGYALNSISLVVGIHVFGMFGLSLPVGQWADRIGRRNILLMGSVIAGIGALLVPSSPEYWVVTLGTFLVGVGWCGANVATTALIADKVSPSERGRAIGVNDALSAAASFVMPLLAGPMVEATGLGSIGLLGMGVMIPAIILQWRLKETSPGKYAH